jgi:hypothetical protein
MCFIDIYKHFILKYADFYIAARLLAHFFMHSSKPVACPQIIETFGVMLSSGPASFNTKVSNRMNPEK